MKDKEKGFFVVLKLALFLPSLMSGKAFTSIKKEALSLV